MMRKPLPNANDARRAIEGVEKQFSALRSADLAQGVYALGNRAPESLIDDAITVADWALAVGGITKTTYDVRIGEFERIRNL